MTHPITKFLRELLQRFFTKSPKFFKIFQIITGCLAFAGYIPSILQRWFNVEVPGHTITLFEDIAKYASGAFFITLMPVVSPPVAVTDSGDILKKTDDVKMPFTAAAEQESAAKKEELPTGKIIDNK